MRPESFHNLAGREDYGAVTQELAACFPKQDAERDPTCAPTRAAFLTGRYSARTGVWLTYASRNHLRRDEITMADVFKRNGYNAGMRGKKTSRYEGGHRGACFLRWPGGGLTGGRDVGGVTAHIDLLPTLIDLCGLESDDRSRFDGVSLARVLTDCDALLPERSVVVHNQARFDGPVGDGRLIKDKDFAVMRGPWRLVGDELYDLSRDPGQRHDIAAEHPETAKALRRDYEAWWEQISERAGEYCPFVINPARQREVLITSQSLLGGEVAYNQRHVRGAMPIDGWTAIDVETPGRYRISLRRWPKEADAAIRAAVLRGPVHPSDERSPMPDCRRRRRPAEGGRVRRDAGCERARQGSSATARRSARGANGKEFGPNSGQSASTAQSPSSSGRFSRSSCFAVNFC